MLIWLIARLRAVKRHAAKFRILTMLLFVVLFGSIAFSHFEKKGIGDAVYWILVTITTVGYGDIYPETTGGRITFVLVALGGIGTIAYIIEQLVSFSTESELKKIFGSGAVKMKKHTIIVGWNTEAEEAIKELRNENEDFLVVGNELNNAELNAQDIPHITGDPTKTETLMRCNIKNAKTIIITPRSDSETIMVALSVQKLNPDIKIVATCESREHVEMMRGAGIDHIISDAEISGRLLAHAVTEPVVVNFIIDATTTVNFDLKQMEVPEKLKLSELPLKDDEKVIALYQDGRFIFNFPFDVSLDAGDWLVVVSSKHTST